MTQKEALKLALEALETCGEDEQGQGFNDAYVKEAITAVKAALANEALERKAENARELGLDYEPDYKALWKQMCERCDELDKRLAQLEVKDEPHGWKLVPIEPTDEMLKAMDECSTEGYDERLYAGYAASVYMAAVDVAPTPPAAPVQEPVAWVNKERNTITWDKLYPDMDALYTTPPQRKPLSDDEIVLIIADCASSHQHLDIHLARAIEAAHGIKGEA